MNDDQKWIRLPSIYMSVTKHYFINFKNKTLQKVYFSIQLGQKLQVDLEIAPKHNKMPKIAHTCGRK